MITRLYAAYGMNCNHLEMRERCTDSEFLGLTRIPGHTLVFRYHCDVTQMIGNSSVICALWRISDRDEEFLDMLEGFPSYYHKQTFRDPVHGTVFYYKMRENRRHDYRQPAAHYLECVRQGYLDSGIPLSQLDRALAYTEHCEALVADSEASKSANSC